MLGEESLYYKLKEYYDILEVDENVDDIKLKKAYRIAAKKYHPDGKKDEKEAERMFKKVSEAYTVLKEENNRKIYSELKNRYEKNQNNNTQNSNTRREGRTKFYRYDDYAKKQDSKQEPKENINRYIFQRRDGSKIEIQPFDRYTMDGQTVYRYRVNQYYKDMTIIDDVYGRINLEELLRTPEYCDFCINNLLSRDNISESQIHYNGYVGYVEVATRNGKRFYRMADKDSEKNFDISIDIGDIRYKSEKYIDIEVDDYEVSIEEIGKMIVQGKPLNQYFIFSDTLDIMNIVYSEDLDFHKIKRNPQYYRAISEKLISENRLKQKIKDGGYIGQVLYNALSDDYDIVVDKEIEKVLNVKAKKEERV